LRILVDAHIFDHSYQGTSTYLLGLYNAMVKIPGVEITLCAQNISGLKQHFSDPGFKFIPLRSASKWKRLLSEIPLITKTHKFDFAHFQYITPVFKHTKFITTTHDILFLDHPRYFPVSYRLVKGALFKWSAKRSDILLTVSNYSREAIIEHFKIPAEKIYITPNAIQENVNVKPVTMQEQLGSYILFVSRFEPRKNQAGLLKAVIDLKLFDRGYNLVFVGGKKEAIEKATFNMVKQYIPKEHAHKVHFLENISSEELRWLYRNAACFVYPSLAEGFGIPPLEAAIENCKVVCSNTTAMKDFGFFKYHVDPNDQIELETKLAEALEDKSYPYKEIHSKIKELYNWDTIAGNFYHALKKQVID
jgi:glycosyltransferase involved in cell wall biosynthesis